MRGLRHTALAAGLTLCLIPSAAQAGDLQPWPAINISAPIGGGWRVSGDVVERIATDRVKPSQTVFRALIGHPVTRKLTIWAGFAHSITDNKVTRNGIENRPMLQINWDAATIAGVKLSTRTRFEYRIIRGASADSYRARQQVKIAVPLKHDGPQAIAWVEPFVALNRTSAAKPGIEQLRGFVGVSVPVSDKADVEFGYLNQYFPRTGVSNNAVPIVLSIRF